MIGRPRPIHYAIALSVLAHGAVVAAGFAFAGFSVDIVPPALIAVEIVVPSAATPRAAPNPPSDASQAARAQPIEPPPAPPRKDATPPPPSPAPTDPDAFKLPKDESAVQRRAPPPPPLPRPKDIPPPQTASLPKPAEAKPPSEAGAGRQAAPAAPQSDQMTKMVSTPPIWADAQLGNRPPVYPLAARRNGWEGHVLLRVDVSDKGRATEVAVAESSGHGLLDEAAEEAVRTWHFRPAWQDGAPVAATVEVGITFRLKD